LFFRVAACPELQSWAGRQVIGEPQILADCGPDGELLLRKLRIDAFALIEVPRQ
jgi:hypothetical protein